METFGERLKRLRLAKGWTQQMVAKKVMIHRTTYTKYETGIVEPPLDTLLLLCELLDTSPSELLGWQEKITPPEPEKENQIV